ncbi:ATP/GTP-binding protein [Streptomyces sp. Je 1-4]|uniref:ATP/GTP-binding protein n=1 Tax=Streptomyces TaxID=1883 RepID=UPI0021DAF729|nr:MULTISPECIES: ATP/GTP-binding protein [unclassified Streptomyces]UYB39201.1 ATP/GTP-binding protein [Streptomyces sp. Je 1-4]UZQ35216.1 ATP/GTP-binding protein [Streptomyces sp. Je 1-4] [Streptomyces sp. Je 1-4 4N24]UZQ42634.1 ATP/GTP-binding protein [Streptomyces sp. Je 1-4] [Streptomyces sp. Je 1-4 4N24_ara]
MADLRALFSSNDPVGTSEAFTNRQIQWNLVATAIEEHLRHIADPGFDVEDLEAPRNNVITFHGVGGVGKSTLLRKLEASLTSAEQRPQQWGAPTWAGEKILPIRIDLARSASTGSDFERVVLTIRLALAAAVGRPLPSFDLVLRRYWDAQHPGEPLEEYVRRTGLVGRFGQVLPQQMQAAVSETVSALALPGLVGSAAGQITTAFVQALRERREQARALAGCARTAALLEAEPDLGALSYYPHLLAWEISRLPTKSGVVPVILLDTFEDTGDRHRDAERLLQRLVWLMPNAFFVISGRNRLPWADDALQGQLDFTGPAAWPGLTAQAGQPARAAGQGGTRQHLIGDFSARDCDAYLACRLTQDGQPLIGPDIRAVIAARSHGLPLHLDLAVARFLEIRRTGRTPAPADFDHTFPALIARTLSDLTADERHVLRSASLLDAFDLDLATQAAGLAHQAAARRLVERPLVTEDPYAIWPYHLHGAIRTALRGADDHTEDRWTPADWHQAAERTLAALGRQWQDADGRVTGRALLLACLRQGLRLARDHQLDDLGWLTDAAFAYTSDSVWEPLAPPAHTAPSPGTEPQPGLDTPADALAELLVAIARRQHEHRERTAERLTAVLTTGLLSGELAELALYYRAKAHKDLARTDEALDGMRRVAEADGRLAPRARRGLAQLARIRGDFPTALAVVPTLGWKGRHHRVLAHIHLPHGDIERAAAAFEAARAEAEQHNAPGERAIAQTLLALVTAFTDPLRADDELTLAHQYLAHLDQRATTFYAAVAALVRDAGTDGDVTDRAAVLHAESTVAGLPWLTPLIETAVAFHHAVRGAHDDLPATIDRLRQETANGDFAYYVDIATAMGDLPQPADSAIQWLDDAHTVRQRWHDLVMSRRRYLQSAR